MSLQTFQFILKMQISRRTVENKPFEYPSTEVSATSYADFTLERAPRDVLEGLLIILQFLRTTKTLAILSCFKNPILDDSQISCSHSINLQALGH